MAVAFHFCEGALEQQGATKMFIRRVCAAAIVSLAMAAGLAGSSYADSSDWFPKGAYGADAYHGKKFNKKYISCDDDVCYDRFGISYHATARYLGQKEANLAYKHYGKQVFLFSPQHGVVCDRRTNRCSVKRSFNGFYGNSADRDNVPRDGVYYGRAGEHIQPKPLWPYDDDD